MINFISTFTVENKEILFSALAILLSIRAFTNSRESLKLSRKIADETRTIKVSEKRSEILELIDRKNAKIGNLLSIYIQQVMHFERCPTVNQRELERVKGNIEGLNELRSSYEEQRGCAEGLNKTFNFETNQNTLSEIKRLLIHIEEEIVKEERNLYLLKSSSSN